MEPIDTNLDYASSQSRNVDLSSRFNWLQFLPLLGLVFLVFLILAVIFQWPVSALIDPVMSLMIVIFFLFVILLFWAMAPRSDRG
jgi:hypothetical protein